MKLKFAIGYVFLLLGVFFGARMAFYFINKLLTPPTGHFLEGLGMGFAWFFYILASILILFGSILLRKHKSSLKKIFGTIVILLGILPQILTLLISPPVGPTSENLIFFLLPLLLYLISGILLLR